MLLKYGVNPTISHVMTDHFDAIDAIFKEHAGREAIITSANDGRHGKNSIHYRIKGAKGATSKESGAIDLRSRDVLLYKRDTITEALKKALGSDYDIILEGSHWHLEFDPKN